MPSLAFLCFLFSILGNLSHVVGDQPLNENSKSFTGSDFDNRRQLQITSSEVIWVLISGSTSQGTYRGTQIAELSCSDSACVHRRTISTPSNVLVSHPADTVANGRLMRSWDNRTVSWVGYTNYLGATNENRRLGVLDQEGKITVTTFVTTASVHSSISFDSSTFYIATTDGVKTLKDGVLTSLNSVACDTLSIISNNSWSQSRINQYSSDMIIHHTRGSDATETLSVPSVFVGYKFLDDLCFMALGANGFYRCAIVDGVLRTNGQISGGPTTNLIDLDVSDYTKRVYVAASGSVGISSIANGTVGRVVSVYTPPSGFTVRGVSVAIMGTPSASPTVSSTSTRTFSASATSSSSVAASASTTPSTTVTASPTASITRSSTATASSSASSTATESGTFGSSRSSTPSRSVSTTGTTSPSASFTPSASSTHDLAAGNRAPTSTGGPTVGAVAGIVITVLVVVVVVAIVVLRRRKAKRISKLNRGSVADYMKAIEISAETPVVVYTVNTKNASV